MHISSVIKISFCRISFSGHQNKFCAYIDRIYGSRVILVMCKNCSDISWHRLNLNQSKTNCPKNLNSDGLIVREMGPWPECIFRSLLQFLVKSRFNEVKQKYLDFCHIYTDEFKVETKVASAYVCPYGRRGYRLRDGCSIFTAEVEAINKALTYVNVFSRKSFVIFSDSLSVLQAIESQESKNPLVNRVLQTCQKISSNGKFITFCWIPSHRDITGNEHADRAAKDALLKAQPTHFELPCTDGFIKIQPFVSSLWQKRWDKEVGNK